MHRFIATLLFITVVLVGCSNTPSAGPTIPPTTATTPSSVSPSSTAPPTTVPPASSVCSLTSTAQVSRLLQSGVTAHTTPSGCHWFAPDATINASLAVNIYSTAAAASTTFQSEQTFDPGQHPFAFGDRAYTSALPALPGHAVATVLVGTAIVTAVVNGPTPQANAIAAAQAIVEPASNRVRQGWRP
jgi:hypothetical protein